MEYRYFPKTSLKVSRISLGTMMFGGQTNEADSLKIMDYAFDQGINLFDTANVYNKGESEKIVGKGLKGRREKIILATKVRSMMSEEVNDEGLSRRHIIRACDDSLKRLDTDYIDIYYMHMPDYKTDLDESLSTMNDLVRSGKIRYVGVSNYASWQMADILALCEKRGYSSPVIAQLVYNALTRGIEQEAVPFAKEHKMAMTNYNPIAGGLLTGKHKPGTPSPGRFQNNPNYFSRYWKEDDFSGVDALRKIADDAGISLLSLAMRFCVSQDFLTTIISGVSRFEQIEQNLASVEAGALDPATLDACDEVWNHLNGTRYSYNR